MDQSMVFCSEIQDRFETGPDIRDIAGPLEALVETSGIGEGHLMATMIGSTGSLTTIEYEPGVVEDLKAAMDRLAPPGMPYAHEAAWHDGNGHSHVQAALMGAFPGHSDSGRKAGPWNLAVAGGRQS